MSDELNVFMSIVVFSCSMLLLAGTLLFGSCDKRKDSDEQKQCAMECRPFAAEVVTGSCFCYDATGALHPKEATP